MEEKLTKPWLYSFKPEPFPKGKEIRKEHLLQLLI